VEYLLRDEYLVNCSAEHIVTVYFVFEVRPDLQAKIAFAVNDDCG